HSRMPPPPQARRRRDLQHAFHLASSRGAARFLPLHQVWPAPPVRKIRLRDHRDQTPLRFLHHLRHAPRLLHHAPQSRPPPLDRIDLFARLLLPTRRLGARLSQPRRTLHLDVHGRRAQAFHRGTNAGRIIHEHPRRPEKFPPRQPPPRVRRAFRPTRRPLDPARRQQLVRRHPKLRSPIQRHRRTATSRRPHPGRR